MIVEPAPAKINLALHVRRRRADGYHDIETLFAFCAHGDRVTVEAAESDGFVIMSARERSLEWMLAPADNLVRRAADAFRTTFAIDTSHRITLDKRLPIAAGIGGGSADAAATLRALARLHGIDPSDTRLFAVAASLGADVPACLSGFVALGTGRGDDLQPLASLAGTPVLLVNPGIGVSTAAVFARWDGIDRGGIASSGDTLARARKGRNDLEAPAREVAPAIGDVLAMLQAAPGVTLARMSGSGATCFALFGSTRDRDVASVQARARAWWLLPTTLA